MYTGIYASFNIIVSQWTAVQCGDDRWPVRVVCITFWLWPITLSLTFRLHHIAALHTSSPPHMGFSHFVWHIHLCCISACIELTFPSRGMQRILFEAFVPLHFCSQLMFPTCRRQRLMTLALPMLPVQRAFKMLDIYDMYVSLLHIDHFLFLFYPVLITCILHMHLWD